MSTVDTYLDEVAAIEREFPGFRIVPKDGSTLCKIINVLLLVLTLGKSKFMAEYITTIGKTIYTPPGWEQKPWVNRWIVLRHEGIHLRQFQRTGMGWFWFGWVVYSIAYIFILPFGLTLRSRWEREAYSESIRCSQRYGIHVNRARIFDQFTGVQYFFMDLRKSKVSAWLDQMGVVD